MPGNTAPYSHRSGGSKWSRRASSRQNGRDDEAACQRRCFAKARGRALHDSSLSLVGNGNSSESLAARFIPGYVPRLAAEDRPRSADAQKHLPTSDGLASLETSVEPTPPVALGKRRASCVSDNSSDGPAVHDLEAKKLKLLQKTDWMGIEREERVFAGLGRQKRHRRDYSPPCLLQVKPRRDVRGPMVTPMDDLRLNIGSQTYCLNSDNDSIKSLACAEANPVSAHVEGQRLTSSPLFVSACRTLEPLRSCASSQGTHRALSSHTRDAYSEQAANGQQGGQQGGHCVTYEARRRHIESYLGDQPSSPDPLSLDVAAIDGQLAHADDLADDWLERHRRASSEMRVGNMGGASCDTSGTVLGATRSSPTRLCSSAGNGGTFQTPPRHGVPVPEYLFASPSRGYVVDMSGGQDDEDELRLREPSVEDGNYDEPDEGEWEGVMADADTPQMRQWAFRQAEEETARRGLSTAQGMSEAVDSRTEDKQHGEFRFRQPGVFVGRLARSCEGQQWQENARGKGKSRARKPRREMGRPDIRAMPDFEDDPIEESG